MKVQDVIGVVLAEDKSSKHGICEVSLEQLRVKCELKNSQLYQVFTG